jgi:pimeloyl-ACP methyl ester carboxylesterase
MPRPAPWPLLVALLFLCWCHPEGRSTGGARVTLGPCPEVAGFVGEAARAGARCGILTVPEDRARPEGRTIDLRIAVVPALAPKPATDPLFILAGGPGQAATEVGPLMLPLLEDIRRDRDVVLVDQRGTGSSNPLDCELGGGDRLAALFDTSAHLEELKACLAGYDADVRHYTTPVAMDDLDEARAALGYERINLYGGSYGTRAALVYLRRHPDHVRAVILDGVAPMDMRLPLPLAHDGQRALDLTLAACREDEACAAAHDGLAARLDALLARLGEAPTRARLPHPRTGAVDEVTIERDALALLIAGALYSPELSALLPLAVARAEDGDFGPFAAMADALSGTAETLSVGMHLSVLCSEDLRAPLRDEARAGLKGTFLEGAKLANVEAACALWPKGALPDGYDQAVRAEHPVLVLSGDLDPVTSPRWGEQVTATLPKARHVVVPGTAHGTWARGCVPDLMARFLETADAAGLDTDCIQRLRRPPFFLTPTGPIEAPEPEAAGEGLDHD